MHLKIRRSQKSGLMGSAVFILDVMAELDASEAELVKKYKLGNLMVYSSEASDRNYAQAGAGSVKALGALVLDKITKRFFTMDDLIRGQHIECKDLNEVIGTENQVFAACQNIRAYLDTAKGFDGSEQVLEIAAA